jgi:hypothetical protein
MLKNHLIERYQDLSKGAPTPTPTQTKVVQPEEPKQELKAQEQELYKFVFESELDSSELAQTCVPPSQSNIDPGTIKQPKQPQDACALLGLNNFILNEYDNESALNGGNLFGSLTGYDGSVSDYVPV